MLMICVQARSNSTRFPNKADTDFWGEKMTSRILRIADEAKIGPVVLLTTHADPLTEYRSSGWQVHEWKEGDVLGQFHDAAQKHQADHIMRLTGDCPLLFPRLLKECWEQYLETPSPYWNNRNYYTDGFDVEIFTWPFLQYCNIVIQDPEMRQHCVWFWREHLNDHWSVDHEEDLERTKAKARLIS